MISPHKNQSAGAGSPRTAIPLRGLFLDGIWRCNCPERPPAIRLQTKNHGVNHGRWFYTCQQNPTHRCKFFLWASDAEAREKIAVLANSHSESSPRTPSKPPPPTAGKTGLITPQTGRRGTGAGTRTGTPQTDKAIPRPRKQETQTGIRTPLSSAKARMMAEDTDEFEWNDVVDTEMDGVLDGEDQKQQQPIRQPDFGVPVLRKTSRVEDVTASSGKRKRSDIDDGGRGWESSATFTPGSVAFASPSTRGGGGPLLTPTPNRFKSVVSGVAESPLASSSELALQVSRILESHDVVVPKAAQEELGDLFNRHELKAKGIARGREISWAALKRKDEQIARLNRRIANLESQRELNRSVAPGNEGK